MHITADNQKIFIWDKFKFFRTTVRYQQLVFFFTHNLEKIYNGLQQAISSSLNIMIDYLKLLY